MFEYQSRYLVAKYLINRLMLPNIYLGVGWPKDSDPVVDVLAIDRCGSGDAHLVLIRRSISEALKCVNELFERPGPYRWFAYKKEDEDKDLIPEWIDKEVIYPPNSAGRIGIIEFTEIGFYKAEINVRLTPERFPGHFYNISKEFSSSHKADIQFED
jgi:hypothetical protein